MAGIARYELNSASPEPGSVGNYPNGQRGSYPGLNMDRSGSFKEGIESRTFGSGIGLSRGSGALMGDPPVFSLMLDPIIMGDQKYTRSVELRRVLGFSVGSSSGDNSFGAVHLKPSPHVAMEELKRFRASVEDTSNKARARAKRFGELFHKLNKYSEAVNSRKQQRNEVLTNERSGGSNLKMGNQIQRNSPDLFTHKSEDRPKNVVLNKRVRTSVAETRAECRNNGLIRHPAAVAKDRDMLKDNGVDSDLVEEKIRRLPAGGEGWEKKKKRKRSVGTVFTRSIDSDAEMKRAVHHKLNSEASLLSSDVHNFRSGGSNGTCGINKLDGASSPANNNARATPRKEQEKVTLPRDLSAGLNKERLLANGSIKLNNREDNHAICSSPVMKGKASRAPRTGSITTTNSALNLPRVSGTLETWEQPPSINKIPPFGVANNRKRAMPSGSSSPPMAQWGGQRPQKISRTRRANLVSPVSNHEEMKMPSEGCSPSEFGAKLTSIGTNGFLLSKGAANATQHLRVNLENVSSPARLSESEESGAGENRLKDKGTGSGEMEEKTLISVQDVAPSVMLTKKHKLLIKEEIGDGVRRQGRSGRGSSFCRASISPINEKLDNAAITKPIRTTRPGSDKSGSKSGRPLKKLSDRKGFSRFGHMPNSDSPDSTGESDDREELLAAANFACNASYLGCSSSFWKKMEPIFASVSLEDTSYLSQQGDLEHEEVFISNMISGERNSCLQNDIGLMESANMKNLVDQSHNAPLFGSLDSERIDGVIPLYERVLSALIVEDDIEEFQDNDVGRNMLFQNATGNLSYDACLLIDSEPRNTDGQEFECESGFCVHTQKHGPTTRCFSCNGNATFNRSPRIQNPPCNEEMLRGDNGYVHSEIETLAGLSRQVLDGPQSLQTKDFGVHSIDRQYEQMCVDEKLLLELQSIGLCLETVPDLDDREDEWINQEIDQLKRDLYQQIGGKKACLDKMYKAIQGGKNMGSRDVEEVAMNRLVELAYKKLMSTRGSSASKSGVAKVSKQVALAFAKRTLSRCRTFEDSGTSCFSEPEFRDVIFAAPPRRIEAEPLIYADPAVANGSFPSRADTGSFDTSETLTHQSDQPFAKNGPISNRGKRKEVLLDHVVGSAAFRTTSTLGGTPLGGIKGKRSERERDKDMSTRNAVAKGSRQALGNFKGDRKTKAKPKQKTAQLSTSGNGFVSKFTETYSASGSGELVNSNVNKKREVGLMRPGTIPQDSSKDIKEPNDFPNLPLHEFDPIELGVEPQDLSSWFNFDEDGLQEHDSIGLEIPPDDISGIMF